MKTVIRRGVFETNSSSTHSVSYTSSTSGSFTFACKSAWARFLVLKALLNHAFGNYRYYSKRGKGGTKKEDYALLKKFYDLCAAILCEKEKVDPKALTEFLWEKVQTTFYEEDWKKRPLSVFKKLYDEESEDLCESLFECGALRECDCAYCDIASIMIAIVGFDPSDAALAKKAEDYLYGEQFFVCTERYAGFEKINTKKVF